MAEDRLNRYGVIGHKQSEDVVLYESDRFYICRRDNEVRYFYIHEYNHDGDIYVGIGELCQDVVPCGFLWIIDELLTRDDANIQQIQMLNDVINNEIGENNG